MSKILIAKRPKRKGLYIPMKGNKANPNLVFPLEGLESSELDELIRAILAKGGVTDEKEIQAIVERAEQDSEIRIKVAEARAEVRRLMELKRKGAKLIAIGYRKWASAFYPAAKSFKGNI